MLTTTKNVSTVLGLLSVFVAYAVFRAATDIPRLVSPQGCRMSWMSPSYVLQAEFNTSWTPLATRYSLLLYREVGWESNQANGLPVLFIPGNAGSSHQVRSIASSATRQYYSSPFAISEEFTGRGLKPLDFYAVEFNEDLSAFHGPTLDAQIAYASAAVEFILSHYPPDTQIIVMGHSMGGVVGTAVLPSNDIKALITMSTPHTLPPARFDARIEEIYDRNRDALRADKTPMLSICGGATDMMIPSETCVLPKGTGYRRTVFSTALEGAWTGVGHREMMWCHQVRWRVARAALELGAAADPVRVLDRWLRDGEADGDAGEEVRLDRGEYEVLSGDLPLVLRRPFGRRTYLVPVPPDEKRKTFGMYVSQGNVLRVSPHRALDLNVSVHTCAGRSTNEAVLCKSLAPSSLRLLPAPIPGKQFPEPDEGSDESEGIVFFEAELPHNGESWVGVTVDAGDNGRGWIIGGLGQTRVVEGELDLWGLLFGGVKIPLPRSDDVRPRINISLPRLPATALLAYRLVPSTVEYPSCTAPLFPALLAHTSQASETHYYRLTSGQPIFLYTHSSGPYVPSLTPIPPHGLNLTIYSSGPNCRDVAEMHLSVDWWASLGRMGTRYPTTLLSWGVGIVSLLLFHSWGLDGERLSVHDSLGVFVRYRMPTLMVVAGVIALLPWSPDHYLGIGTELGVLHMVLAATLVGVATGMVCVSWWLLVALMWPLRLLRRGFTQRKPEGVGVRRGTVISMIIVLALIFLFVPWQVAFLGCWITQLFNCNATLRPKPYPGSVPTVASTPTLVQEEDKVTPGQDDSPANRSSPPSQPLVPAFANAYHQNAHMLLLMTWLLPLAAPVLAVWVRTLQTAGYTTPFNGDHNVLKIAPFLILVDLLGRARPLDTTVGWRVAVRWGWLGVAAIAFLMGGRKAWMVYDAASVQIAILLIFQGSRVVLRTAAERWVK